MNNARNQKCMVLILAMIVGIGFVSCGDDDNENTVNEPYTPSDSRAVDLGLSVNWAKMNVGANAPDDCGLFFAWGETKGYTSNISDDHQFDYAEYKWMTAGQSSPYWINKYQVADQWTDGCWFDSNQRFIGDGKKVQELADYWSSSLKTILGGCGFNFSANDGTSMYISTNDYSRNTGLM